MDVYTQRQRVRVFLGIGRGIRRWVRIRASVPGAYLRSGYRLGKFRLEYVEGTGAVETARTAKTTARTVHGARGHPTAQTHAARRSPKGMPCGRYTARTREEGRSHSPEPSRNGLKPPSASRPTVRHAFCASRTLLGRSDRTTAQSNKSNGSHCNHPWSSAWCVVWWAPAPTRVMP